MMRRDFIPRSWLAEGSAGLVAGFRRAMLCFALAPVIYGGMLTPYLGIGLVLFLVGAGVAMAILALRSPYAAASGGPQDTPAAVLFTVATALAATPGSAAPEKAFATTLAFLMLASLLFGVATYLLGRFRLGRIAQFLPYPVIGGFMAGTGWLLLGSGIKATADLPVTLESVSSLLQPETMAHWLPALLCGGLLFTLMRRFRHAVTLPVSLLTAVAIFYLVAYASGLDVAQLQARRWLLVPAEAAPVGSAFAAITSTAVDWSFIVAALPTLATLVVLSTVQLLLNVAGVEAATGHEIDTDGELRATGVANIVAAPLATLPSYLSLGSTLLAWRAGATTRWLGLAGGAFCLAMAAIGPEAMVYAPRIVIGAMIFMEAIDRMHEWLVAGRRRMAWYEYAIVLVILAAIALVGFLPGILLGTLVAMVVFVADYSRINPVRSAHTLVNLRSAVARSPEERRVLDAQGHRVVVLRLHGFVFFGTAGMLYRELKSRAAFGKGTSGFVVIDFHAVTGADGSAGYQFAKIARWLHRRRNMLVLTDLSPAIRRMLERSGVIGRGNLEVRPNLDLALEWVEDRLLDEANASLVAASIEQVLTEQLGDKAKAARLLPYLEPVAYTKGDPVLKQGDVSDDVYFIEGGACSAVIEAGGRQVRLRKFGPGALFGEMALYTGRVRTASVIADTDVQLRRLSSSALARIAAHDPEALAVLHELMARIMAERIAFQNRQLAGD